MNAHRKLLVLVIILGVCLCGWPQSASRAAQWDRGDREEQVAAWLSAEAGGVGRTIVDRAAWEALGEAPGVEELLERATRLIDEPLPEQPDDLYLEFSRTGNRTHWQSVASNRRGRIGRLTLAACLTADGRFIPPLVACIEALCAERTWVYPAHDRSLANFRGRTIDIDLGSSRLAWELALCRWMLGDRLPEATQRLIADNVRRRVLAPFLAMVAGERSRNWWMTTTNNWNAVCLAGVTGAGLALIDDAEERARFIVAAEEFSRNFLRGFTADGYCSEGLGYWNYGFGNYVKLAETIHRATAGHVDLLARQSAQAPARFGMRIGIVDDVYPAFADCSVTAKPDARIMQFLSRRLGFDLERYENQALNVPHSLAEFGLFVFPNSATEATPERPAEAETAESPLRTWFPDAQVLISRAGQDTDDAFGVAMKGGHNNEHHNHNDVGSYVVVTGGRPVLLDPGNETYTARTFSSRRYESGLLSSLGHAVPVVDGSLQRTGRPAAARVVAQEFTDIRDVLTLDLSAAYDVAALRQLRRTFTFDREARTFVVEDAVAFSEARQFATTLITGGSWLPLADDPEGAQYLVFDRDVAVTVRIETGEEPWRFDTMRIVEDARVQPTRLGITLTQSVTQATIRVTIRPWHAQIPDADNPAAAAPLLTNGDFALSHFGWSLDDDGMSRVVPDLGIDGTPALRITDTATDAGSSVYSMRMPVEADTTYRLQGMARHRSGNGCGVYMLFFDANGHQLNPRTDAGIASLGSLAASAEWSPWHFTVTPPADCVAMQLWLHTYNASQVDVLLDNLEVVVHED